MADIWASTKARWKTKTKIIKMRLSFGLFFPCFFRALPVFLVVIDTQMYIIMIQNEDSQASGVIIQLKTEITYG